MIGSQQQKEDMEPLQDGGRNEHDWLLFRKYETHWDHRPNED
jgi:hypothetical protein